MRQRRHHPNEWTVHFNSEFFTQSFSEPVAFGKASLALT